MTELEKFKSTVSADFDSLIQEINILKAEIAALKDSQTKLLHVTNYKIYSLKRLQKTKR
jgi:hypothetical protein